MGKTKAEFEAEKKYRKMMGVITCWSCGREIRLTGFMKQVIRNGSMIKLKCRCRETTTLNRERKKVGGEQAEKSEEKTPEAAD